MKLRSLLSLEGVGLESNRSSALTEYGCEQVVPFICHILLQLVRKEVPHECAGGC